MKSVQSIYNFRSISFKKKLSSVQQELQTLFIITEMQLRAYNYNASLSEQASRYLCKNCKETPIRAYFQSHGKGNHSDSAYLHRHKNHTYISSCENSEGLSFCPQNVSGKKHSFFRGLPFRGVHSLAEVKSGLFPE